MIGFLTHTNPYILNVMQQCCCSYFELGLAVVQVRLGDTLVKGRLGPVSNNYVGDFV